MDRFAALAMTGAGHADPPTEKAAALPFQLAQIPTNSG
jgi:hypothetical protein